MTKKEFLECVNGIDDDLIEDVKMPKTAEQKITEECKPVKKRKAGFLKYVAAACIVLVAGAGIVNMMLPSDTMKVGERNTTKVVEQIGTTVNQMETTRASEMLVLNNAEFNYNNKNYKVINNEEFLYSNNLMPVISKSDIGVSLKKNILDTSGNNVLGDLYSYKNSFNQDIVILKANDGSYNFAFSEEGY